jgi:hypothetical protein
MMVYDWETGETRPLVKGLVGENPNQYTWDPTLQRGLFSHSSHICARIRGLNRDGVADFPITITHGGVPVRVDGPLTAEPGGDCGGEIRSDLPDWSPDGETIAFFASPQSLAKSGFSRLDQPWNLYLVSAASGGPARRVVQDVVEPHELRWSPDGRWLAYVTAGEDGGGWLYSPEEGLHRFASDPLLGLAWSPDGDKILALRPLPGDQSTDQDLVVFDVSDIAGNSS